jgi:hypothetical protein
LADSLWISWYDLREENRDAYVSWLHGTHMPQLVARRGFSWAAHYKSEEKPIMSGIPRGAPSRLHSTDDTAIPRGNAYILVVGAEHPHVFADPTVDELREQLPAADRKMLDMRVGERVNIFVEEARADGPEASKRDAKGCPAPCIQLGSFNRGSASENEILAWYARWRLPSMSKLPGCVGIRKLVSVSGWAKHGVLYEFTSLDARNKYFPDHEKANPEKNAWTDRLVRNLLHAPGSPSVALRLACATR